ncbi:P2X purinoceptor 4-like isoform X2 [Alosa pseudoharengus]|uniref:P2X purinoceptor 4-like isoform X2 n=1 Tax=Alosa pseudoharengus TaxID=34774 RepID=UPI003F8C9DD3
MPCSLLNFCEYETHKLVKIKSVKLGSMKWMSNGIILMFICIMLLWNKEYQAYDLVISSVTTKVKGVGLTNMPDVGDVVWDVVDHSGPSQGKNSFFVVTNFIATKQQKQGKCPETPQTGRPCRSDKDCEKGYWDQHSHGVQTGVCVKFDVTRKTCEVAAWCPIEKRTPPPRPALLASAENFTVLIKNNIRFPAFNYIRRNILPEMTDTYLKKCIFNRRSHPYCPIFRLGDIVTEAKEKFTEIAVEGGVIGVQINWDCDLNRFSHRCLPGYSFRRLDEKESNRTLYPGLNFRQVLQIWEIQKWEIAGKFSIIQLIIYIGSTLSYYALTTVFLDWLIGTRCYSREARKYSERKFESVQDQQECLLCISFVDEDKVRLVKRSKKKSLQAVKPISFHPRKDDSTCFRALVSVLQPAARPDLAAQNGPAEPKAEAEGDGGQSVGTPLVEVHQGSRPPWCQCGCCPPSCQLEEQLCCRREPGRCLTSSPLFPALVLRRSTLETLLLYQSPLAELHEEAHLRRGACAQFISWRFGGALPQDAMPVMPRCCVARVRAEFPSPDGRYEGLTLSRPLKPVNG